MKQNEIQRNSKTSIARSSMWHEKGEAYVEGYTITSHEDVVDIADIKGIYMSDTMKKMKNNAIAITIGQFNNGFHIDGLMKVTKL